MGLITCSVVFLFTPFPGALRGVEFGGGSILIVIVVVVIIIIINVVKTLLPLLDSAAFRLFREDPV